MVVVIRALNGASGSTLAEPGPTTPLALSPRHPLLVAFSVYVHQKLPSKRSLGKYRFSVLLLVRFWVTELWWGVGLDWVDETGSARRSRRNFELFCCRIVDARNRRRPPPRVRLEDKTEISM